MKVSKLVIYYDGGYETICGILPCETTKFLRTGDLRFDGFESRFMDWPYGPGYVMINAEGEENSIKVIPEKPKGNEYSDLILLNGECFTGEGEGIIMEVKPDNVTSIDFYNGVFRKYTTEQLFRRVNNF